jgi:predicted neuraminidase
MKPESGDKTKNIHIFLVIMSLVIMSCSSPAGRWKKGIVMEEFIFEEVPFPSCHASTIAETPEGLVAAWFGGTYERHPDVCIWVSRKDNGQWTSPVEVANGIVNDTTRYPTWNPVLYQSPGGDLLLFYKVGPSPSSWWGVMKRSGDGGVTWSDAEPLPDDFIGPVKNKPVLLKNGNLLCGSSTEDNGWRVHMEITDDAGVKWEKTGPLNDPGIYQVIQPTILMHNDGSLQILCRSKNSVIAESWSFDDGKTWTLFQDSELPNNNSGIDGVTLEKGKHLLVYNHVKPPAGTDKGYRTPLNVAVSKDGMKWYAALILEDSQIGQYSYPSVIQSADGMIHIVYTWRREKIKYVKVDPDKLKLKRIKDGKWPG